MTGTDSITLTHTHTHTHTQAHTHAQTRTHTYRGDSVWLNYLVLGHTEKNHNTNVKLLDKYLLNDAQTSDKIEQRFVLL